MTGSMAGRAWWCGAVVVAAVCGVVASAMCRRQEPAAAFPVRSEERSDHEAVLPLSASDMVAERCVDIAACFKLTPREVEVLQLLAQGRTRSYIQEVLVLSDSTVKTHISHIYTKLGIGSRQELLSLIFIEDDQPS